MTSLIRTVDFSIPIEYDPKNLRISEKPTMEQEMKWNVTSLSVTCIVTLVAALLPPWFQAKSPSLEYIIQEPFSIQEHNEGDSLSVYRVLIRNSGNDVARDVVGQFSIPTGTIRRHQIDSQPTLTIRPTASPDALHVVIPSLNPGEGAKISLFAFGQKPISSRPLVSLRAEGVVGKETHEQPVQQGYSMYWLAICSLVGLMAGQLLSFLGSRFSKSRVVAS